MTGAEVFYLLMGAVLVVFGSTLTYFARRTALRQKDQQKNAPTLSDRMGREVSPANNRIAGVGLVAGGLWMLAIAFRGLF